MGGGHEAQEAHDEEHGAEAAQADEVEGAAADAQRHEEPGAEDADHVDAVLAHGEGVGLGGVQAGLLQEVGRVVGEGVAAEVLDGPDHADDLGAAQVGALEAVEVAGTPRDLLLEGGRVDHHGDGLVGVEVGLAVEAGQAQEGALGVLDPALPHQPPRRLGGEEDADEQRDGPHPLQGVGDAVGPLVVALQHGLDDADADELAEAPAEVDVGGEVAAQGDGADLGGVGDGEGLEDAPRDAGEDLGGQQGLDVLRGEEDGGPGGDEDEAGHDGVSVAEALRDVAVDEEADDLADVGAVAEAGLPLRGSATGLVSFRKGFEDTYPRGHLVGAVRHAFAVLAVEGREGVEVGDEADVVALHGDAGRDDDTPHDGLGVELDALQQGHLLLLVGGRPGVLDDLAHGRGLLGRHVAGLLDGRLDRVGRLGSHGGKLGTEPTARRNVWLRRLRKGPDPGESVSKQDPAESLYRPAGGDARGTHTHIWSFSRDLAGAHARPGTRNV